VARSRKKLNQNSWQKTGAGQAPIVEKEGGVTEQEILWARTEKEVQA